MKVTIYELLGLVKDGKAPKKVKYGGIKWEYTGHQYRRLDKENLGNIWNGYNFNILNDEVEILEEEKKIPEKLENEHEFYSYAGYEENKNEIDKVLYILKAINLVEEKIGHLNNSVNEIIDYLKIKDEQGITQINASEMKEDNLESEVN